MLTKFQREKLIKAQHETCGLCKKRLSIIDQICHDSVQNKMVCRRCMLLLSCLRAAQRNGVSFNKLVKYEEEEEEEEVE